MKLPPQAIEEFKTMYAQKYGVELSDAEAQEQATELLNLYVLSQGENIFHE